MFTNLIKPINNFASSRSLFDVKALEKLQKDTRAPLKTDALVKLGKKTIARRVSTLKMMALEKSQ